MKQQKPSRYLVVSTKKWNHQAFHKFTPELPGEWHLWSDPNELQLKRLQDLRPAMIFFPHWSWIVPPEILDNFTCVCFHMTALPYGRGGSPLQNLIIREHKETSLTALKMTRELDAGPIYTQIKLSLEGSAQEIFERAAILVYDLIQKIITENPAPTPQEGKVTVFQRRKPEQSELPGSLSSKQAYDYIRMLDAEGYPKAYIKQGGFRIEFSKAQLDESGKLLASAEFFEARID